MPTCLDLQTLKAGFPERCKNFGGLGAEMYFVRFDDIATYSFNATTGVLDTFTLKATKKLSKFYGRRVAGNSANTGFARGENLATTPQTVTLVVDYDTQADIDALNAFKGPEDIIVFYQTNAGKVKVAGLNKDLNLPRSLNGLRVTDMAFPEGQNIQDSTAATITFNSENTVNPPVIVSITAATGTQIAHLDTLAA